MVCTVTKVDVVCNHLPSCTFVTSWVGWFQHRRCSPNHAMLLEKVSQSVRIGIF